MKQIRRIAKSPFGAARSQQTTADLQWVKRAYIRPTILSISVSLVRKNIPCNRPTEGQKFSIVFVITRLFRLDFNLLELIRILHHSFALISAGSRGYRYNATHHTQTHTSSFYREKIIDMLRIIVTSVCGGVKNTAIILVVVEQTNGQPDRQINKQTHIISRLLHCRSERVWTRPSIPEHDQTCLSTFSDYGRDHGYDVVRMQTDKWCSKWKDLIGGNDAVSI